MISLSLTSLANAFYELSTLLGLASFSGLILVSAYLMHSRLVPAGSSVGSVKNPDAILMMLGGMTAIVGAIAKAVSFFGRYVMKGLAVFSVIGFVLAVVFWQTGEGLHDHELWALVSARLFLGVMFLSSAVSLLALRGALLLMSAAFTVGCGSVLLSLMHGFPPVS